MTNLVIDVSSCIQLRLTVFNAYNQVAEKGSRLLFVHRIVSWYFNDWSTFQQLEN